MILNRQGQNRNFRRLSILLALGVLVSLLSIPSLAQTTGYIFVENQSDYTVNDLSTVNSPIYISGQPSGAVVTRIRLSYRVVHTYPGDLVISLTNAQGSTYTLWNRYGGSSDGGYDDDAESDQDIEIMDRYLNSEFDGDNVNQTWYLRVADTASGDTGYINWWNMTVDYEYTPPQPNLNITSTSLSDSLIFPDDTFYASATVKNIGSGSANSTSQLYYYFSDNTTYSSGERFSTDTIPALSPNSSVNHTSGSVRPGDRLTFNDPSDYGTYYVIYRADANNDVIESNENDNSAILQITISRPQITTANLQSYTANVGNTLTFRYSIYNPDNISRSIGLGASIRPHGTTSWIDDDANDRSVTVPPGTSGTYTRTFQIPSNVSGGQYDIAWGIHNSSFTQLYDFIEDNSGALTISELKPNLDITSTSLSDNLIFPDDTITASAVVKNIGVSSTGVSSQLDYYFSDNDTWTAGERFSSATIPILSPNASANLTSQSVRASDRFTFDDPSDYGTYYIIYRADANYAIDELDENDNKEIVQITISRPQITTGNLQSYSANAGDTLTFRYNIYNPDNISRSIGLGASIRPTGTTEWIDGGSEDIVVTVPPGTSGIYTRSFTIPEDLSDGQYDIAWGIHNASFTQLYDFVQDASGPLSIIGAKPTINTFSLTDATPYTGKRITFSFNVCNPQSSSVTVGLYAAIRTNSSGEWQGDWNNEKLVTVPGGCSTQQRYFDVPVDANGTYDVLWEIRDNIHDAVTETYDSQILNQYMTVSPAVQVTHNLPNSVFTGETKTLEVTVTNVSDETLDNVWLGLDIYDSTGQVIENTKTPIIYVGGTDEMGLIDYDPYQDLNLVPGETRTFTTSYQFGISVGGTPYNPGEFEFLFIVWENDYPGSPTGIAISQTETSSFSIIAAGTVPEQSHPTPTEPPTEILKERIYETIVLERVSYQGSEYKVVIGLNAPIFVFDIFKVDATEFIGAIEYVLVLDAQGNQCNTVECETVIEQIFIWREMVSDYYNYKSMFNNIDLEMRSYEASTGLRLIATFSAPFATTVELVVDAFHLVEKWDDYLTEKGVTYEYVESSREVLRMVELIRVEYETLHYLTKAFIETNEYFQDEPIITSTIVTEKMNEMLQNEDYVAFEEFIVGVIEREDSSIIDQFGLTVVKNAAKEVGSKVVKKMLFNAVTTGATAYFVHGLTTSTSISAGMSAGLATIFTIKGISTLGLSLVLEAQLYLYSQIGTHFNNLYDLIDTGLHIHDQINADFFDHDPDDAFSVLDLDKVNEAFFGIGAMKELDAGMNDTMEILSVLTFNAHQAPYYRNRADELRESAVAQRSFQRIVQASKGQYPINPPTNDLFKNALVIPEMPYTLLQATSRATSSTTDPILPCLGNQGHHSLWYRIDPQENGTITFDTYGSSFDTGAAAWQGSEGNLSNLACNDNIADSLQGEISFDVLANQTYYIEVVGKTAGDFGQANVKIVFTPNGEPTLTPTISLTPNLTDNPPTNTSTPTNTPTFTPIVTDTTTATNTPTFTPIATFTPTATPTDTPTFTPTPSNTPTDGCGISFPYNVPAMDVQALRNAINCANENQTADTIRLLGDITIADADNGYNALPQITSDITIDGNGFAIRRDTNSAEAFRIFYVTDTGNLTLNNLTVSDGLLNVANEGGAGIRNLGNATLTHVVIENNQTSYHGGGIDNINGGYLSIYNSVLRGNTAASNGGGISYNYAPGLLVENTLITDNHANPAGNYNGGGIAAGFASVIIRNSTISNNTASVSAGVGLTNSGSMEIINSTISGNSGGYGAGIDLDRTTVTILNSTIVNNYASTQGSGIRNRGTVVIKNSIVANNTGQPNCYTGGIGSSYTRLGVNYSTDGSCGLTQVSESQLALQSLADNGGNTLTHALGSGSVAIDSATDCTAIDDATPLLTDQRGVTRPIDGDGNSVAICDVGSFEFGGVVPTPTFTPSHTPTFTPMNTATTIPTHTLIPSHTPTFTSTVPYTSTATGTPTFTSTATTHTPTATGTMTPSYTPTNTFTPSMTPSSTPTSTPTPVDVLNNGGFEGDKTAGVPNGWGGSNTAVRGKDKQKCDKPELGKYFAYSGDCAFMFKGNLDGSLSRIKQTINASVNIVDGATLVFSVYVDNRSAKVGHVIGKLVIKYDDTSKDKAVLKIPAGNGYILVSDSVQLDLTGRNISKIKLDFRNRLSTGKFFIDDASLKLTTGSSLLRSLDVLPLPEAPSGFKN